MIIITGSDTNGVLYGAVDFEGKYLSQAPYTNEHSPYYKRLFYNNMPEYEKSSSPSIKNRAFWTWGHVIYDYQGFIDNMTRLKLNMIVIWNDFIPVNAKDIVAYAHSNGIKVIWGYSWAWGVDVDIDNENDLNKWTDIVLSEYENKYAPIGGDGIYFQSFTETEDEMLGGVLIAEAVTKWVNKICGRLLEKYPELEIQFGLHATSVKNKLEFLRRLNKEYV